MYNPDRIFSFIFFFVVWASCVAAAALSVYIGQGIFGGMVLGAVVFGIGGFGIAVLFWLSPFIRFFKDDSEDDS